MAHMPSAPRPRVRSFTLGRGAMGTEDLAAALTSGTTPGGLLIG